MDQAAAEAILQRLPMVTADEARMLRGIWEGGDAVVRQRAWVHGKQALTAHGADDLYQKANAAVSRWIGDYATGGPAPPYEVYASYSDMSRLDARIGAAPAILDAILGTLLHDLMPRDEIEELLAPWGIAVEHADLNGTTSDEPIDVDDNQRGDTHP